MVVDNADHHDHERTQVVLHSGDPARAQQVADLIRCGQSRSKETDTRAVSSSLAVVDVTVILGRDFNGRFCQSR